MSVAAMRWRSATESGELLRVAWVVAATFADPLQTKSSVEPCATNRPRIGNIRLDGLFGRRGPGKD